MDYLLFNGLACIDRVYDGQNGDATSPKIVLDIYLRKLITSLVVSIYLNPLMAIRGV